MMRAHTHPLEGGPVPTAPTYAQRRLGSELRRLRTRAGLKLEETASAFTWSLSKLSRIETAHLSISPLDMTRLAKYCGATDDELARLTNWATQRPHPSRWWKEYSSAINSTYEEFISLEDQARHIHLVDSNVIPGLFQAQSYARAITECGPFVPDPDIIDVLVEVRMARKRLIFGDDAVKVSATMSATALQINMGSPSILNDQLNHLLKVSNLPNIDLRIMPTSSPCGAFNGGLTLFDFEIEHEPSVVYIEYQGGMTAREETREVRRYRRHIDHLHQCSLSVEASHQVIIDHLERL